LSLAVGGSAPEFPAKISGSAPVTFLHLGDKDPGTLSKLMLIIRLRKSPEIFNKENHGLSPQSFGNFYGFSKE